MNKLLEKLKTSEKRSLILVLFLLLIAALLYLTRDEWMKRFQSHDPGTVFGKAELIENKVERKGTTDSTFSGVKQDDILFLGDTVVTAPNARGRVRTSDGSMIELFPGSRVVLSGLDSSGVEVTVLQGEIEAIPIAPILLKNASGMQVNATERTRLSANEKAPPPITPVTPPQPVAPTATQAEISSVSPKDGATFAVKPGAQNPSLIVPIEWTANQDGPVNLTIGRDEIQGVKQPTTTLAVPSQAGSNRFELLIQGPGTYRFNLESAQKEAASPKHHFEVVSSFAALGVPEVVLSDGKSRTNRWDGIARGTLGAKVSWKPYPGVTRYSVRSGAKRWFVNGTTTELTAEQIDLSRPSLVISGWLPSGFEPRSSEVNILKVEAPEPKLPKQNSKHSLSKQTRVVLKRGVLLTWERTHYVKGYEVEVNKTIHRAAENFFVIENPSVGAIQWRVRGQGVTGSTPWSKPRIFTLAK